MNEEASKEITTQPQTKSEGEQSVIKEFFLSGGSERELGALFGQSETELKKEFGSYKAQKIYRKLNYFIDSRSKLLGEVKSALKEALKYGYRSVTVFPSVIALSKSVLNGAIKVRALINYPYGEDLEKSINYQVKQAIKSGADEVLVPFSAFLFRCGDSTEVISYYKKLIKSARVRRVSILLDLAVLTLPEVESAISLVISSGISSVVLAFEGGVGPVSKAVIEDALSISMGLVKVECIAPISKAEDAISTLINGVDLITSKSAQEISRDLSMKIEVMGANENA